MAFVQADLVKFWPPSQGCSYILVLEDHYTKYVVLYPVRDKNTLTIAKRLTDYRGGRQPPKHAVRINFFLDSHKLMSN